MPLISRFFGISIYMYRNDHNPPHFHAQYGDDEVLINLNTLEIMKGHVSPRVLSLIIEWASQHRSELVDNWESIQKRDTFTKIEPLA